MQNPRRPNLPPPSSQLATDRLRTAILRGEASHGGNAVTRLAPGTIAMAIVMVGGTLAYRSQEWSWSDSLYMVVITIFTVGYGEVQPVDTEPLRMVTMFVIIFGYVATLLVISGLAQWVMNGELRKSLGLRRMIGEIQHLQGHVILCGYGRMGQRLASTLKGRKQVLVLDPSEDRTDQAIADGYLAIRGNAVDESLLMAAGIKRADAFVAAVPDDATCLFMTITARELNHEILILARGEQQSTEPKLRAVGADHVVLTASIGADRLSQLILRPSASAMLCNDQLPAGLIEDLVSIGITLDELCVQSGSPLCGNRLSELTSDGANTFLVVAIRTVSGNVIIDPPEDTTVTAGDTVIVLGHEKNILSMCSKYGLNRNEAVAAERRQEQAIGADPTPPN
ncbi:MAG: NAD-binding protein [Planctomycetota bacterium]